MTEKYVICDADIWDETYEMQDDEMERDMRDKDRIEEYVESHYQETIDLLKKLAVIPAPSGCEEKRAEFVLEWLHHIGANDAFLDEAGNVIFPYFCDTCRDLVVIMAHMDVVCPDTCPLPLTETEERLIAPGVRDDTANLVNMLMAIKYILSHPVEESKTGILFVADVGEEGLGNLKGSRQILQTYRDRIREWISFDLNYDTLYTRAVGSRRYRIGVRTKGGHSYHDFGTPNAIAQISELICDLYRAPLLKFQESEIEQEKEKTDEGEETTFQGNGASSKSGAPAKVTYNVGKIKGGTSVNTIAQEAAALYEIRSESEELLNDMENYFHTVLQAHRDNGVYILDEVIGVRPGNGPVDVEKQSSLEERCLNAISTYYKGNIVRKAGSTDCNIPLSAGIPAVTVGTAFGEGTHTREEWLQKDSMRVGQKIALQILCSYF